MSTILIADDSPSIRLLLKRRLEMAGHDVTEARDGLEALIRLDEADRSGRRFDVVLLDALMPRLSGAEALDEIRDREDPPPVIAISAVWDLGERDEWKGADAHMGKPIDFDRLFAQIEALTAGRPLPGSPNP